MHAAGEEVLLGRPERRDLDELRKLRMDYEVGQLVLTVGR